MKLHYYGIRDVPLQFFKSYLSGRKQKVYLDGVWSQEVQVSWGVPQGSILGPFLFLISINDLPFSVRAKTILYADDTTLFNIADRVSELEELSQIAINDASVWFKSNGFLLNEEKLKTSYSL